MVCRAHCSNNNGYFQVIDVSSKVEEFNLQRAAPLTRECSRYISAAFSDQKVFSLSANDYGDYLVTFYFLPPNRTRQTKFIMYLLCVFREGASCCSLAAEYNVCSSGPDIVYNSEQIGARVRFRVKMHLSFKVILYHAKELYFSEIRSLYTYTASISRNYTRVTFARSEFIKMCLQFSYIFFCFYVTSVFVSSAGKKFMKYLRVVKGKIF